MNTRESPGSVQDKPLSAEPDMTQANKTPPQERFPDWPVERPPLAPVYTPGIAYPVGARPSWAEQPGMYTSYPPRRPRRWPWIALTLVLLFLLFSAGVTALFGVFGFSAYANSSTETRTFSMATYPMLVINNDTGSIHVRATSSGNEIAIQATKNSTPWANPSDIQVTYTPDTAANTITVNVTRQNATPILTALSVDFDVTVPSAAALHLKTNTGSIDVNGVSGQMTLSSNTGSLQVDNGTVRGPTSLTTNTGSVTFNAAISASGTYILTTDTGSINMTLPATSVFHLDASTSTGSINTSFPGVVIQHGQVTGADAHSDVGSSPQAIITLKTSTGSINLNQR